MPTQHRTILIQTPHMCFLTHNIGYPAVRREKGNPLAKWGSVSWRATWTKWVTPEAGELGLLWPAFLPPAKFIALSQPLSVSSLDDSRLLKQYFFLSFFLLSRWTYCGLFPTLTLEFQIWPQRSTSDAEFHSELAKELPEYLQDSVRNLAGKNKGAGMASNRYTQSE